MSTVSRTFTIAAVVSVGLLAAACGKPSGKGAPGEAGSATVTSGLAPKGGSCLEEKAGLCHEYTENPLGMAEGLCKDLLKGTYSKNACPTADLVGTCKKKDGDKTLYYFANSHAAWVEDAKKDCEKNPLAEGATFTAAPGAEEAAKTKAIPTPNKISGSCANPDGTVCEDHFGEHMDLDKEACSAMKLTWSTTPCATEELYGSCLERGKVTRYYKKMTKLTKASAMQNYCESNSSEFLGAAHWYPAPGVDLSDAKPAAKAASAPAKAAGAKAKAAPAK